MKFIIGLFKTLKETNWPDRKQRWKDYLSVLEYTFFFTVIIFIFDRLIAMGLIDFFNRF